MPHRRVWLVATLLFASTCGPPEGGPRLDSDALSGASSPDAGPGAAGACGLPAELFADQWATAFPNQSLAPGVVGRELFTLLTQLDAGSVPAAFPSLLALTPAQRRMTISAAVILASSQGFALNCPNLRRLAFGAPKSIAEITRALNLATGSPLTLAQLATLPFERQYLVWELATANDTGEGLNAHASSGGGTKGGAPGDDRVVSQPATVVANPVKQFVEALVGAVKGRDTFPPKGAANAGKRWVAAAESQAALDALLFELGDHSAPPAPVLAAVPSPTRLNPITVAGSGEPGGIAHVSGGAAAGSATVGAAGSFSVGVALTPNAENQLAVAIEDAAGNFGRQPPCWCDTTALLR